MLWVSGKRFSKIPPGGFASNHCVALWIVDCGTDDIVNLGRAGTLKGRFRKAPLGFASLEWAKLQTNLSQSDLPQGKCSMGLRHFATQLRECFEESSRHVVRLVDSLSTVGYLHASD